MSQTQTYTNLNLILKKMPKIEENSKWFWDNCLHVERCKRIKLDPHLSPCTNIIYIWAKDLNATVETFKLLEKKPGKGI